jgi:predicted house-cleaning noncanonical NTP pyrophosphatase (MazG superfamily)
VIKKCKDCNTVEPFHSRYCQNDEHEIVITSTKKFDKLVRDKIPEILRNDPNVESFETETSRGMYARHKLVEEATEACDAFDKDVLLTKLADLQEVMLKVAKDNNIKFDEILIRMVEKQQKYGKFDNDIVLKEIVYK